MYILAIYGISVNSLHAAGYAGETASAVVVLESAVRQYEDVLGIRHPGISTLSKKAEKLLASLDSEQREQVRRDSSSVCPLHVTHDLKHYVAKLQVMLSGLP